MAGVLTIHYGLMGSGKTLFAMQDVVLPAVKAGRPFFTNITGIDLSAISWLTGVHQTMIKYYPVENIQDVIKYFDNNEISHDGVFVLDEMKDFIDDEKAVQWLESRINITRKMGVDFLFIAQQNKKQYIHPDLIGLCDSCNYFASRKQQRDTSHVDEYFIQGGDPKVVNKIPLVYDGVSVRNKDERVFLTYRTSDSKYYAGKENDTYRGLYWYQTRKWKLRFVLIGIATFVLLVVGFLVYNLFSFTKSPMELTNTNKVGEHVQTKVETRKDFADNGSSSDAPKDLCYNWKVCDGLTCKTDIGTFISGASDDGRLCVGKTCYAMCQDDNGISGRGGLLHDGEQVPKGDGKTLFSFGQAKGH